MKSDNNDIIKSLGCEILKNKKFNGKRLESARYYRGMTIIDLADEVGVSKQAISQFENGIISPQFDTLMKIVTSLNFPREYFFEEDFNNVRYGNTFFRAQSKVKKLEEERQAVSIKFIGEIHDFLSEYIEFPKLNLPDFEEGLSIEEKALKLREYWGLGIEPIKDIIYVMEKNGIIVSEICTGSSYVDAFTQVQVSNGVQNFVVVLGNDKGYATRRQFSAAHELGHIILHDPFINPNELSSVEKRSMEKEAHEFASAFLLPAKSFSTDVSTYPTNLEFYKQLKKKWRTSISAMLIRANHLDIINYNSYQNMMRKMGRNGWRTNEPLDDTLIMRHPTVLKRAVNILLDNDILDADGIIATLRRKQFSIPREEIENLLNLDKGTLNSNISELPLKVIDIPLKNIK